MKLASIGLAVGLCLAPLSVTSAQERPDSTRQVREALRVFMDCRSRYCDFDHFRREITFVDYVRNRQDAQVHVLVTTLRTGGGGDQFTIAYIGQREFESVDDSLTYFSSDTDTYDEVRGGLTQSIKLGLVRYAARTGVREWMDVTYTPPDSATVVTADVADPWNFWIFRARVGSNFNGEERQQRVTLDYSMSANRTTEVWRTTLWFNGRYAEDEFELSDGTRFTSFIRNYGGGVFMAQGLGEHLSVGASASARASTFSNHRLTTSAGPAVEYNFYPYSQSTRRAFTLQYTVQVTHSVYNEITIFNKVDETRPAHGFEADYSVRQPFGTVNLGFDWANFLDDFSQHSARLDAFVNVRLVRGLELNVRGSFARIKNQIYLPRGGASDEEVLLRRRELGTAWRYGFNVSVSYTFGSIFNNVVNPRFR